jgi:hypothetical protein
MTESNTAEGKPKLVPIGRSEGPEAATPPPAGAPPEPERESRGGIFKWLFVVAVVLLILALYGLSEQVRRVEALSGQVEGLEVQLSAANVQLRSYDMQLERVRKSVGDVLQQMSLLHELVHTDPMAPRVPAAPPPQGP